jgi:transposase InsO family protein
MNIDKMADSDGIKLGKFNPSDVESCASEWEEYKRRFLIHLDAKGLYDAAGRRKVGQLLKHMGPEHVITYDSFIWQPAVAADAANNIQAVDAEDRYNLETVFGKFDTHFGVHRFRSIKRQEFLRTTRDVKKQSIMNFIADLRTKARHCDYGDLEESIIIDMVINKVNDSKCTEKLMELSDDQLTLNNIIRVCRQVELTQAHVKSLEAKSGESEVHSAMKQYDRGRTRGRYNSSRGYDRSYRQHPTCSKCCRSHGQGYCRAESEYCCKCGEKGHFFKSPLCKLNRGRSYSRPHSRPPRARGYARGRSRAGRSRRVYHADNDDEYFDEHYPHDEHYSQYDEHYDDEQFDANYKNDGSIDDMCDMFDTMFCDVFIAGGTYNVDENDFQADLYIHDNPINFELDTGAKCNIMNLETLKSLRIAYKLQPSSAKIRGVHGKVQRAIGSVVLPCRYKDDTRMVKFQVLNTNNHNINLLGSADCVKFGMVARVYSAETDTHSEIAKIINMYKNVFDDVIGCLPGEYDIKIDENAHPVVHPPRSVPVALREKVRAELNRLEAAGIVAKVVEPTPWVNSMVVVSKKDIDQIRICIDPSDLNKVILREHFPMNNIDEIASRLAGSTVFTTLDAKMGYFQIKLSERSSLLTTFNTPFGRYRMLRMPMGAKCSADKFQQVLVEAFNGIDGVEIYQDDILVHGKTHAEHNNRLRQVLKKCQDINLKLNRKKCQIGQGEVAYVGHKLTGKGLKPTDDRIQAIKNLKIPESLEELETMLGMVVYVAKFIPNLSTITAPLRELKYQDVWNWTEEHQSAFDQIKSELTSGRVLRYFDVRKPLLISVDASSKGLGAAAIQNNGVIAYASRALTTTEQKYAQIEKEMLAVVYGLTKFHKLAYGKSDVTIESDHKPLESLLKKAMNAAPMRIQRMRLKLEPYTFDLVHVSGKTIGLADCLSRNPMPGTNTDVTMDEELMVCRADTLAYKWHDRIEEATTSDEDMSTLKRVIFHGWPADKSSLPAAAKPFWDVRDQLSTYNGVIFKGERIVIPSSLRGEILRLLHSSHMGMVKTKQRARDVIYWPGLNKQIEEMAGKCEACLEQRTKQQKEPMNIHPIPALPWNKVGADLFEYDGVHYLLLVDYYSNFIEVVPLHQDTKSTVIIKHMKINIARYGIMETLVTDNGPQFASAEFSSFTKKYGINHVTSSPTHPQSNGLAEEGVRQVKDLMKRCQRSGDDFFLSLLDLRNTPRDDDMGSPMQRLQGRRAQTQLPTGDSLLKPSIMEPAKVHDRMMQYRRKQKLYYDKGARPLPPLDSEKGLRVWTPHGWKPAEYISNHEAPNSYRIRAGKQGLTYRRNRKHLMITGERPHIVKPQERNTTTKMDSVNHRVPDAPTNPQPPRPPRPIAVQPPIPIQEPSPPKPPTPRKSPPKIHPQRSRPTRNIQPPVWMKDYDK